MKKLLVLVLITALVMVNSGFGATQQQQAAATVSVKEFLSITLNNTPVGFPDMDPGTTTNASSGALIVEIGDESNVNVDITTRANSTTFINDSNSFAVGNMTWSIDNSTWTGYLDTPVTACNSLTYGDICDIYHRLSIPSHQAAGAYSVGIIITATSV